MTSTLSPPAVQLKHAFEILMDELEEDGNIPSLRRILSRIADRLPSLEPSEVAALFKRCVALQSALQDPRVAMRLGLVEGEPVPDAAFAAGANLPVSVLEDEREATTLFDLDAFLRALEPQH